MTQYSSQGSLVFVNSQRIVTHQLLVCPLRDYLVNIVEHSAAKEQIFSTGAGGAETISQLIS